MIRRTLIGLLAMAGTGIAMPQAASATEPSPAVIKVTLVTGETVGVSAKGSVVSLERGGKRVFAAVEQGAAGISVIPPGADRLLASGRVDPALFNVTQLIAQGYDDRREPELPVIARYKAGSAARATGVRATGVRATAIGPRLTGMKVPRAAGPALWRSLVSGEVEHLWLDRRLTVGRPRVAATAVAPESATGTGEAGVATAAAGGSVTSAATGKGVRVAVISGGVDATHPDLKGRVVASRNFTYGSGDTDGDGTAIASLIAGSGAASGGKYKGLASDARIVDAKVFNSGDGSDSTLIAGMDWAARTQKVKVAVLGVGRRCWPDSSGNDLVEQAIADLTSGTGTLFVVPAADFGLHGNPQTLCSPGTSAAALTVGGTDSGYTDQWAGTGPRKSDHVFKPEISADTRATVARSSTELNPSPGTGPYTAWRSTDISAARVGAAAALLSQSRPTWTPAQYKAVLISTAAARSISPFQQGAGTVDVARALRQSITSTPGTHSIHFVPANRTAVSRRVSVTNRGKTTRTLTVSLAAHPDQTPAPPKGMFTTKTTKLVLKPGKSATVTVRIDPAKAKTGDYVAVLTVTGGRDRLRSVLGAWVQPASQKLTIKATHADGVGVNRQFHVVNLKSGAETYINVQNGIGSAVLQNGTYAVTAAYSRTSSGSQWMIGAQVVTLGTAEQTITFAGATAKRAVGRVQGEATTEHLTEAAAWVSAGGQIVSVSAPGDRDYPVYAIPVKHSAISYGVESRLLSTASPRLVAYEVAHVTNGGIPDDPTTTQTRDEMAKVVATLTNHSSAIRGGFEATTAIPPNMSRSGMGVGVDFPSQLTMYVTGGFTWDFRVRVYEPGVGDPVRGEKLGQKLEAGKIYEQTWDLPAS